MTQHRNLSEERWAGFALDQQILMIANEMNRASSLLRSGDIARTKSCYERVLQLTGLRGFSSQSVELRGRVLILELVLSRVFGMRPFFHSLGEISSCSHDDSWF